MANGLSRIEHIVVLMQENRSFDNLLGWQFGELDQHLAALRAGTKPAPAPLPYETPAEARPYIKAKLTAFLGREEGE